MRHREHMQEFYFSDKKLGELELSEIKNAIPGGEFGFTGLETGKGFQYSLIFSGDFIPLRGLLALDKYRLHK